MVEHKEKRRIEGKAKEWVTDRHNWPGTASPPPKSRFHSSNNEYVNLIDSFQEFKELKSIDRETMMGILEEVFRNMIIKKYGATTTSTSSSTRRRPRDLAQPRDRRGRWGRGSGRGRPGGPQVKTTSSGEEVSEEIKLADFGRRNVLSMRQNLAGKVMELEKDALYRKYKDRVGEIVCQGLPNLEARMLLVDDDDNEPSCPRPADSG